MNSSLNMDAPVPPEILMALADLEKALEAAVEEGSLREGLQWTAAIDGAKPWLVLMNAQPVKTFAEQASAAR